MQDAAGWPAADARRKGTTSSGEGGTMSAHPVVPQETPQVEGSTAEAHQERPDGGIWEHPWFFLGLIVVGAILVAGFFVARIVGL
ncbi:DUF6480 family protein [Streptomyces sp. NPDC059982]|uniref:DUF6480 family protein n=1 Tax=unclassified Streptomyces TaxID=2593676 RepID=UPI003699C8D1